MATPNVDKKTLQKRFFVISRKVEGKGIDAGYVSWVYRLKCKKCDVLSPEVSAGQKGIPDEALEWSAKHKCKKKKKKKGEKKKPRPG